MNKPNINQLRKAIGKEALLDLMEVKSGGAAHASNPVTENDAEQLARTFHEVYERLAPDFGYETRKETREFDPTTPNGKLMIAVCRELLSEPWRRKPAHASEPEWPDFQELLNAAVEAGELRQGDADYVMGLLETSFRSRASMAHASERIKMVDHASEQGADTKRLETFVRNWPQVHKAIRSDIMLGEAAEEITALAELYAALSQTK